MVGVHLKKDEDCAFGSWTMLLLTTLPRVLPGADGAPAFWGNNDEMEKRDNTLENLGWERNWATLLALPVELLLIEESERRLVGRRTCLRRDSRLCLAQLRLHREELVLERGTWGRRALGYGRASRARGNHNWGGLWRSGRGLRRCKDCDGGCRLSLRCRRSESQVVP